MLHSQELCKHVNGSIQTNLIPSLWHWEPECNHGVVKSVTSMDYLCSVAASRRIRR